MNRKTIAVSIAALGVMAAASPVFADDARPQPPQGMGIGIATRVMQNMQATIGTVSAVSGTSLTITMKDGKSMTVDASSAIVMRAPATTIQLSDVLVGDTVLVQGEVEDGVLKARHILDGIPDGKVTISARTGGGTQVMISASTSGEGPGRKIGVQRIIERAEGGAMATSVPLRIAMEKEGWVTGIGRAFANFFQKKSEATDRVFMVGGAVSTVGSGTFTILSRAAQDRATTTITVMTDASTTYKMAGGSDASFADIAAGSFVKAQGSVTSTSTMTILARRVEIATSTPRGMDGEELIEIRTELKARIDQATSTQQLKSLFGNIFQRLGGFFRF